MKRRIDRKRKKSDQLKNCSDLGGRRQQNCENRHACTQESKCVIQPPSLAVWQFLRTLFKLFNLKATGFAPSPAVPPSPILIVCHESECVISHHLLSTRKSADISKNVSRRDANIECNRTPYRRGPLRCGWSRFPSHLRAVLTFAAFSVRYGISRCGGRIFRCRSIRLA